MEVFLVSCLFIFSLISRYSLATEIRFTTYIPGGVRYCFFETVKESDAVFEAEFQVIAGELDLSFTVHAPPPTEEILASTILRGFGSHKLNVSSSGDYAVCLDNQHAYRDSKYVAVQLYVYNTNGSIFDIENIRKLLSTMETSVKLNTIHTVSEVILNTTDEIKRGMNYVERRQFRRRSSEARDYRLLQSNAFRVWITAIFNTVLLLVVAIVQVISIRYMFDRKDFVRSLGKARRKWMDR